MSNQELITANEYGFAIEKQDNQSMVQIEQSRAVAEVQAPYIMARANPRDQNAAFTRIMKACERPFLAEQAMYAYPRGGQVVTGPSIRLAEVLAQSWGNVDCGVREISQSNGVSVAEAYAIDLESNTRITKIFHVKHERHTKKGKQLLTDPRDIYELVANQGSRRMRACILAIIPGDVIDAAVEKCKNTLTNGKEPMQDRIRKMVIALDEQGIKIEHIEKRLGHKLDSIIESELITLRGIYKALKDGVSRRQDFFDLGQESEVNTSINDLIESKKSAKKEEVIDSKTGEIQKVAITEFDKIKKKILNAKSSDELAIAADLISSLPEENQQELTDVYLSRVDQVK